MTTMKLNIPIEVGFDDLNSMIDELGKLQKYKLGEGDDMTLVDVCDITDILMRHVKAKEAKRGTHWIPYSEQEYPSDNREVEVTCEFKRYDGKKCRYACHASYVHRYTIESTSYNNWEYCEEYNEKKDMYYALPGWYERIHNWDDYSYCAIEDRVVAWRELPEPYRGENE